MSYELQANHSGSLVFFAHLNDDSILHILHILCNKGVMHNYVMYFIAKTLMAGCNCIKFALTMQQNFVLLRKLKNTFFQILVRHVILKIASITSLILLVFCVPIKGKELPP